MSSIRHGYIIHDNERIKRGRGKYPYLNRSRATLLLLVTLLLTLSNPGNDILLQDVKNPLQRIFNRIRSSLTASSAAAVPPSSSYGYFQQPQLGRITNYGLFSIEEKIGSINILVLQNSWKCPHDNMNFAPICDIVGTKDVANT